MGGYVTKAEDVAHLNTYIKRRIFQQVYTSKLGGKMNNTTFAIYKGIKYSAGFKNDGSIVLHSKDIKDLGIGFTEKKVGKECIFIKYVTRDEIEEIYDMKVKAIYQGYEFEVIDEKEDEVSIVTMTGDYRDWLNLDMKCIDKGVYQKWISKGDAEIKIVKEEL